MTIILAPVLLTVIVFVLLLYWHKKAFSSQEVLFSFLLVLALTFLAMFCTSNLARPSSVFYNFLALAFYVLLLTLAPAMHFYVISLTYGKSIKDILRNEGLALLLPLGLLVVNVVGFFIITFSNPESAFYKNTYNIVFFANFTVITFLLILQNLYYVVQSVRLYQKSKLSDQASKHRWVLYFILAYVFLLVAMCFQQISSKGKADWSLFLVEFGFIGLLAWRGKLVSNEEPLVLEATSNHKIHDTTIEKEEEEKESVPPITDEQQQVILEKLEKVIREDRIYTQPELSISSLAKAAETNDKYLRFVIGRHYNLNFVNFINQYRVEAAKVILVSDEFQVYTIESIGQMVGFNSKSAFYASFKYNTKLTPYQFRQQHGKKDLIDSKE